MNSLRHAARIAGHATLGSCIASAATLAVYPELSDRLGSLPLMGSARAASIHLNYYTTQITDCKLKNPKSRCRIRLSTAGVFVAVKCGGRLSHDLAAAVNRIRYPVSSSANRAQVGQLIGKYRAVRNRSADEKDRR
jgi:hypothetical protein